MRFTSILAVAATAVITVTALQYSAPATADAFADAEDAVKYRQSAFSLIRENFGHMAGMVRGEIEFDAESFQKRAEALKHLSYIPFDGFSGAGHGVTENSDALPSIWENWGDFSEKSEAFNKAAHELATASQSGDLRSIRPKFMATARTCQQCHEGYRAD
ncbi:cytochrome c556 [Idiomarina sp. A28L]|uniref:c-type cytochrome n=1 Tax=Idiomarina sp. A28L TaxID=1036674 RepID=UPI0002138BC9|nr:cytochrome c [Idiomarina sp. A28L]EGN74337.1 cytochrome c556 [Idiomarina sp. A28L]